MNTTHDAPPVSEGSAPCTNTIRFAERRHNAFLAQSRSAIGPEGFIQHLTERREKWPKSSGLGASRPKEKNAYHRARHQTRGVEALRPGAVPSRSREHVNRNLDALRFKPCLSALKKPPEGDPRQTRVLNRQHRNPHTGKRGRFEWTSPTRWRSEMMAVLPQWVLTTTMLLPSQKTLLAFLYLCIDMHELHQNGRFVVRGVTQSFIGHHLGLTPGHISKLVQDLERKGFLERRRPDFAEPLVYYLARYENSAWTYPALSRFSGRARLCRAHGGPHERVDWEEAVGGRLGRRKKKRGGRPEEPEQDEAEAKLERDRQRQRTPQTGLHGLGQALGGLFGAEPPGDPPRKPPD